MILECSCNLKNCSCDRNFCRKSNRIHPQLQNEGKSYSHTQLFSVTKHSDKNGTCILSTLMCIGICCVFLPICGLWIGPILYYIRLLSGELDSTIYPTSSPTLGPTLSPILNNTDSPTNYILELLNNTINNVSNITT